MSRWGLIALSLASTGCPTPKSASLPPAQPGEPAPSTSPPPAAPSAVVATPTQAVCGDAKVEQGERCDDANTTGGDGCSASCRREPARFFSWSFAGLADGSVVSRKTGQALPGRVTLAAAEAALIETEEGSRYFYGSDRLLPLPSDSSVVMLGAGRSPCVLNDRGEVWCVGGEFNSAGRPQFELGPRVTDGVQAAIWNKLRRAPGPVAGLAGNIDVGCLLLDRGTTTQCWVREPVAPGFSLSAKMPLGRGRVAKQLVAGSEHFCVLLENGEVGCWGDSSYGQTGYVAEVVDEDRPELPGPERRRRTPPDTFLKFDSPAKWLAASDSTTCALLANGKLWCWGDTDALAFEDPTEPTFLERMQSDRVHSSGARYPKALRASTLPRSPIQLPRACTVREVSLLSEQLCVSCEDGCSKCWGKSAATPNAKKAAPPDECLTY